MLPSLIKVASCLPRRQLLRAGRGSLSYDIVLDRTHDLASRSGFFILLAMGLAFLASIRRMSWGVLDAVPNFGLIFVIFGYVLDFLVFLVSFILISYFDFILS